MDSGVGTASPRSPGGAGDLSGGLVQKKFLNGWTKEQETLMAEWADIAGCYRWLHDRAEKIFTRSNMMITIPVIVLSTLTGTANFAVGSFIDEKDDAAKKLAQASIGAVSIFAGILSTLGNFFQYAQKSESHKVAGINWGKFQRQVTVELAIHPDERIEAMDFLKICRQDLDRLIEQSPAIPETVVTAFEREFKSVPNLKVPDICHGIEHTRVYDMSKARVGKIAADAVLHLRYKKNALAKSILPDIDKKIEVELNTRIDERVKKAVAAATATITAAAATPQPATAPEKKSDPLATLQTLETDWRRLLISRKSIYSSPGSSPTMKGEGGGIEQVPGLVGDSVGDSGEVHIDIVGSGTGIGTGLGTGSGTALQATEGEEESYDHTNKVLKI